MVVGRLSSRRNVEGFQIIGEFLEINLKLFHENFETFFLRFTIFVIQIKLLFLTVIINELLTT